MSSPEGMQTDTSTSAKPVEADFLIIGTGPAGASLACFLAKHNLTGIIISSSSGPARTPRAHVTNSAAFECLRDTDPDLYAECERLGNDGDTIAHYRFCETMAGVEYGRARSWGTERGTEYDRVSPCRYMDLPQNMLEPILHKWATSRGWTMRFNTTLLGFVGEGGSDEGNASKRNITVSIRDDLTRMQYQIRTRFLFGADGGRSTVARILDLPFTSIPGGGFAYNVLVKADMTHLMQHRTGNLHVIMRLDKNIPFVPLIRMVKPWKEWVFVFLPKGPQVPNPSRSPEAWVEICKDIIGDDKVTAEVLDVSGWQINETSANIISRGNIFCLGDAVHRHPPTLGLGSNTCIQDAFNLAWKISFVYKGLAHPSLLSTYNAERQPIAASLVTESNAFLRDHNVPLWHALGLQAHDAPASAAAEYKALLASGTPAGRARRQAITKGIRGMHRELHALGTAMGQLYTSSLAIFSSDEPAPFTPSPAELANPRENYTPCTYPGRRLPHVWLGTHIPGPLISTLDIAGKGRFAVFTGIGGERWVHAAGVVRERYGVEVKVVRVGVGCEWADVYCEWEGVRGVEEDGCVLVRPDCVVAWRAEEGGREEKRLVGVMGQVLGFGEDSEGVGRRGWCKGEAGHVIALEQDGWEATSHPAL